MIIILFLIPLSILIGTCFLVAFIWAVRSGQYEDTSTPSMRLLLEDKTEGVFNLNSESSIRMGSTGHRPIPSGDPPLGMGEAFKYFKTPESSIDVVPIPSGQWPDGTSGSLVPPKPILKNHHRTKKEKKPSMRA